MTRYPFQLQYREFEHSPPSFWLVMPFMSDSGSIYPASTRDDLFKSGRERTGGGSPEAVVMAVPLGNEDNVFKCQSGKQRVPQSFDLGKDVWDCKGRAKERVKKCDVVSSGHFEKERKHGHYWVDFEKGKYAGTRAEFTAVKYKQGQSSKFGNGFVYPKNCTRIPVPTPPKTKTTMGGGKKPATVVPAGSSVRGSMIRGKVKGSGASSPPKSKPRASKPAKISKDVKSVNDSYFFENGYYRKANSCPKSYKQVDKGDKICGDTIPDDQAGSYKFDALGSLQGCVTDGIPYIVETKFNGHRGILEFKDGKASIFSGKGRDDKPLPDSLAKLTANYLSDNLSDKPDIKVVDVILDGEVFLKECDVGGNKVVPEIGMQTRAIKGDHPELYDKCKFSYKIFDIMRLNGVDVSEKSLTERKRILGQLFPKGVKAKMSDVIDVKDASGKMMTTPENLFIDPVQGKKLKSVKDIYNEYCRVTRQGQEGLMIKDPEGTYDWRGRKSASRANWYKLKEEFDVDTSVTKACLGPWKSSTKTNTHLTRYKQLDLSVCKDSDCKEMVEVATSGSNAGGGPISGWDAWDDTIHFPILNLLLEGKAEPSKGAKFRKMSDIEDAILERKIAPVNDDEKMQHQMGCNTKHGCYKDKDGDIALPECIDIPPNDVIVEVVTTEINMDGDGNPHLGGPPRVIRIRNDKKFANDISYLHSLYGRETGINPAKGEDILGFLKSRMDIF